MEAGYLAFGTRLHEAWQAKRGLSAKVSNTQIDRFMLSDRQSALCGKLLGAGGGGFMLFFSPKTKQ